VPAAKQASKAASQRSWQVKQPTALGWKALAEIAKPNANTAAEINVNDLSFIVTLLVSPESGEVTLLPGGSSEQAR